MRFLVITCSGHIRGPVHVYHVFQWCYHCIKRCDRAYNDFTTSNTVYKDMLTACIDSAYNAAIQSVHQFLDFFPYVIKQMITRLISVDFSVLHTIFSLFFIFYKFQGYFFKKIADRLNTDNLLWAIFVLLRI